MPYYIAFDLSHKPRGKIDENLSELRDHLNANGFICYNFLETPITQEKLKSYDILVFSCPDFSKFSNQEIIEITNWVKEDGGGLLMLSHAGGDKGRNSNLGDLSQQFGIIFEGDQVLDKTNNLGVENLPLVSADHFIPPHPITNGIGEICYRAGCSLIIIGGAISIITSNETSEPFSCPLMCTAEPENGRVCAIGSYEMFRDKTGGGLQYEEHADLALNIFNWLVSDYRMEITIQGTDRSKITTLKSVSSSSNNLPSNALSPINSFPENNVIATIDILKNITSKSELMTLLQTFQTQINNLKYSVDSLIQYFNTADNNLFAILQEKNDSSTEPIYIKESGVSSDFMVFDKSPLTDLPPRPMDFDKKDNGVFIGLEPINLNEAEKTSATIPKSNVEVISKTKGKIGQDKEELQAELEGLQSKLNSVHNLINFIDKKHESGKLDDNSYKKQTRKLNKDLEQTQKRIEEIKNIIG
jgi:uncharacterized membrane protein